ncbi:type I-E CRISPR-associated endoribonuclease Cas2e [Marinactinospora rubrisoli]|uniref:Type I-E CRISPR-associated endoribonuclease Cas2e n=1 Tax=Marinactinospora rubrisoli TaxID=2715399 RepID=A0ABW2KKK9_9ACTN
MANMVVISTSAVPDHVRGALTRWMIEPRAGLYVGTLSARVREELWDIVQATLGEGSAVCIHPTDNEQRFLIRTAGPQRREVVDWGGPPVRDDEPGGGGTGAHSRGVVNT